MPAAIEEIEGLEGAGEGDNECRPSRIDLVVELSHLPSQRLGGLPFLGLAAHLGEFLR